jgi:hypothetical protein
MTEHRLTPETAADFYEDDEDPQRVFVIFDVAKREGRLRQTAPPDSGDSREPFSGSVR